MIINGILKINKLIFLVIKYNLLEFIIKKNNFINKFITVLHSIMFKKISHMPRGMRLKITLEKLGPIFIKLGQLLSTRIDIIPIDIIMYLKKLQTETYEQKIKNIKYIIQNELKCKIEDHFKKINENPIASASIAQIHTGILKNNKKVIIKIIKPNIKNIITTDINILYTAAKLTNLFITKLKRLKLTEIIKELKYILANEINLKTEAANLTKMKKNFEKNKYINIPEIYWELCKENILTIEYIEGINITNIKMLKKTNVNIKKLSFELVDFFYTQTLKHGFFHADLHPGNIIISKSKSTKNSISLIDFGIVSSIKNNEKNYLIQNILAFSKKDYRKVAYLHIKAKTISTNESIDNIEKEICCVFEPILNKKIKDISFKNTFESLMHLAKKFNMQIQPKLILFQKTLITIEALSRQLNPNINLWKLTRQSIEKIIISNTLNNYSPKKILKYIKELTKLKTKKTNHDKKKLEITNNNSNKIYIIIGYIIGCLTITILTIII